MLLRLSLTLILFSQTVSAARHFGHDQGNGGDVWSLQFIAIGEQLLKELGQDLSCEKSLTNISVFSNAVRNTRVESTDEDLFLDGKPKDAINFPRENLILFNSLRWAAMDPRERRAFVRHEYSSISGKENASYSYSRVHLAEAPAGVDHIWCTVGSEGGHISLGVDESTNEAETILIGFQLSAGSEDFASDALMLATGSFQSMMDAGRAFLHFPSDNGADGYIFSVNKGPDGLMSGYLFVDGIEHPIRCDHPSRLPPPMDL